MIVTIQGYNGKKNKSLLAAGLISSMAAMARGTNTLVLQLIDSDEDSLEKVLTGRDTHLSSFGGAADTSFSDEGIDALFRAAETSKLSKADFDPYCTGLLSKENGLDVTAITRSQKFSESVETKVEMIEKICKNAREVYENIILLLPYGEASRRINGDGDEYKGFADMSIYCLKQGHTIKSPVYGKDIIYVVTDFDGRSKYTLKSIKKDFGLHKEPIYKIERNTGCTDAYMSGGLLEYVRNNRDLEETDSNFAWSEDIKNLVRLIERLDRRDSVVDYDWEHIEIKREKELSVLPAAVIDMEPVKKNPDSEDGGENMLFMRKKKEPEEVPDLSEALTKEAMNETLEDIKEKSVEDDLAMEYEAMQSELADDPTADVYDATESSEDAIETIAEDPTAEIPEEELDDIIGDDPDIEDPSEDTHSTDDTQTEVLDEDEPATDETTEEIPETGEMSEIDPELEQSEYTFEAVENPEPEDSTAEPSDGWDDDWDDWGEPEKPMSNEDMLKEMRKLYEDTLKATKRMAEIMENLTEGGNDN